MCGGEKVCGIRLLAIQATVESNFCSLNGATVSHEWGDTIPEECMALWGEPRDMQNMEQLLAHD